MRSKTSPLKDTPNGKKRGRPSTHDDTTQDYDEDNDEEEEERPKKRAKRSATKENTIVQTGTKHVTRQGAAAPSKPVVSIPKLAIPPVPTNVAEVPKSKELPYVAVSPVTTTTPQQPSPSDNFVQPAFASLHFDFHVVSLQPSPRDVKPLKIDDENNLDQQVERLGSPHTHSLFDDIEDLSNNNRNLFEN